jgi:hypothetical protein
MIQSADRLSSSRTGPESLPAGPSTEYIHSGSIWVMELRPADGSRGTSSPRVQWGKPYRDPDDGRLGMRLSTPVGRGGSETSQMATLDAVLSKRLRASVLDSEWRIRMYAFSGDGWRQPLGDQWRRRRIADLCAAGIPRIVVTVTLTRRVCRGSGIHGQVRDLSGFP